jgi:dolichol kinase
MAEPALYSLAGAAPEKARRPSDYRRYLHGDCGVYCLLFFDKSVAVSAMLFLSLGDPVAALVGRRMPGPRLFGKLPGGTAAFVGLSLLVVTALVRSGAFQYHWGLLVGAWESSMVKVVGGLDHLANTP